MKDADKRRKRRDQWRRKSRLGAEKNGKERWRENGLGGNGETRLMKKKVLSNEIGDRNEEWTEGERKKEEKKFRKEADKRQ